MKQVYTHFFSQVNLTFFLSMGLVFIPPIFAVVVYWPGLSGAFIFDDFPNFSPLSLYANADTYTRVINFILTGGAGPTGRPVSLASFMINDTAWPSDPRAFIYTNLMIHLLNGILIFWLLYKILTSTGHADRISSIIASITSLIWLLHPLNISSVLYVIQRMTELGSLFTLAGLVSFMYGREYLNKGKRSTALWCLYGAYPVFGLLAIFSKEIGVTLLLYIVVLEVSVLQLTPLTINQTTYKLWYRSFVLAPLIVVLGYLISTFSLASYQIRNFNLTERLLTESRILMDYLGQILLPRIGNGGLFHDDYQISTSLLNPASTLASIIALFVLLAFSIKYRKRFPYYSFAGLWFLTGHALESTFIGLELYFEHRNYLPMLAPLLALVFFAVIESRRYRLAKYSGIAVFTLLCIFYTSFNASLWGKPKAAAVVWAKESPASIRAQQAASAVFTLAGKHREGKKYIQTALHHHPLDGGLLLQIVHLDCFDNNLTSEQLENLQQKLPNATRNLAAIGAMMKLATSAMNASCPPLDTTVMHNIINTLLSNRNFNSAKEKHALYYWQGQLYAAQRQLEPAMEALDKSLKYHKIVDVPLQQAMWLHSAGLTDLAKDYIEVAKQIDQGNVNPLLNHSRANDISKIENKINNSGKATNSLKKSTQVAPTSIPLENNHV